MLQNSRDRVLLIERLDNQFTDAIRRLEAQFFEDVRRFYENELLSDGSVVINSTDNLLRVNRINELALEFTNTQGPRIASQVAQGFNRITTINEDFFNSQVSLSRAVRASVRAALFAQYGIADTEDGLEILGGGWLSNIARFDDPFRRVQEIGIRAVSRGIPLETFRSEIRDAAFDTGARSIAHHFRTNANDAYAQFDRNTQTTFANELGFICFIYEGGLVDNTRDFCEERNGQVFTIDEADTWSALQWKGKNKSYDPLRDMGGHNCRHHPSYISDELAITLRPELAQILPLIRQRLAA